MVTNNFTDDKCACDGFSLADPRRSTRRSAKKQYKKRHGQRRYKEYRRVNGIRIGIRFLRAHVGSTKARQTGRVSLPEGGPRLGGLTRGDVCRSLGTVVRGEKPHRAWRRVYNWMGRLRQRPNIRSNKIREKRWVPRSTDSRTKRLARAASLVPSALLCLTNGTSSVADRMFRFSGAAWWWASWAPWLVGVRNRDNPFVDFSRGCYLASRGARWVRRFGRTRARELRAWRRGFFVKRWAVV